MAQNYQFRTNEPSILVEIYMPKKAKYQGILYEALKKGFELNCEKHFTDNKEAIKAMLDDYRSLTGSGLYEEILGDFRENGNDERVFWGYSIYEVDGMFYQPGKKEQEFCEERTTIIKIIFKPDYENFEKLLKSQNVVLSSDELRIIAKYYLRSPVDYRGDESYHVEKIQDLLKYHIKDGNPLKEGDIKATVLLLKKWECKVGMFLFGYVLFTLCEGVKNSDIINKIEDEIWVSSQFHFNVNRLIIDKNISKPIEKT